MNRPLQADDLCITFNTNHPANNDGALIMIVKFDHTQLDKERAPMNKQAA